MPKLTKERAQKIARAHACSSCQEYTFRRLTVKAAAAEIVQELGAVWIATKTCGVCSHKEEIGIDDEGDVVYAG